MWISQGSPRLDPREVSWAKDGEYERLGLKKGRIKEGEAMDVYVMKKKGS